MPVDDVVEMLFSANADGVNFVGSTWALTSIGIVAILKIGNRINRPTGRWDRLITLGVKKRLKMDDVMDKHKGITINIVMNRVKGLSANYLMVRYVARDYA